MNENELKALIRAIVIRLSNISGGFEASAHGIDEREIQSELDEETESILELYKKLKG